MANDRPVSPELVERRIAETVDGLGLPTPTESELALVDAVGGLQYAQLGTAGIADDAITSAKIALGAIQNLDIATNAGILVTKLAAGTAGQVLLNNNTPAPTWATLSGDVTVNSTGVTAIGSGVVVDADVASNAAIALTKLANVTAGSVVLGNASNVPTATALSGDVTVNSTGVTAISAGAVANAEIASNAAIALTKLENVTAGRVILGNASNVPTATALSGDVTVNSTGVTAISAGAVVNADLNTATGELGGVWNTSTAITGFTNVTGGTVIRRWLVVGKTLYLRAWFTTGTATAAGGITFPLPAGITTGPNRGQILHAVNGQTIITSTVAVAATSVFVFGTNAGGNFGAGASLTNVTVQGVIELT